MKTPFWDLSTEAFRETLALLPNQDYRYRQVREWIIQRRARSFAEMSNLPHVLRSKLDETVAIFSTRIVQESTDSSDGTKKLLLELHDQRTIESVLIVEGKRRTVCLSTQVGCGMGCVFCATGLAGLMRNLSTGEMIEQLLQMQNLLPESDRLTHIVVMGMGEPLANLDRLLEALAVATAPGPTGLGLSARHVTISTVGLPAMIRKLAATEKAYHLAISLHAPNNELRAQIVPAAERVELRDLIDAGDYYRRLTGRQVTFEYVLLANVNDRLHHAEQLAKLVGGRDSFINLIPYNPVMGLDYRTPVPTQTRAFAERLRAGGCTVKIRKRKGARINAACGQLARAHDSVIQIS